MGGEKTERKTRGAVDDGRLGGYGGHGCPPLSFG